MKFTCSLSLETFELKLQLYVVWVEDLIVYVNPKITIQTNVDLSLNILFVKKEKKLTTDRRI